MRSRAKLVLAATATLAVWSNSSSAQDVDYAQLIALDGSSLQRELTLRYDAGLAASLDPVIVGADDTRYLWALETKTQCAIALGYLKSSTRDETSIRKCQDAYLQLMDVRPPSPIGPPPPPMQRPAICSDDVVGITFFDFDSAQLTSEAAQTLDTIVANIPVCGWRSLQVEGHTDQAGSDAYNIGLSQERAQAVASALQSRGVAGGAITTSALGESNPRVPLPDGTRSPQNRRVEISAD